MRASSSSLATSLARRLNEVVPAGFRLAAEDERLRLRIDDSSDVIMLTLSIVEDERREMTERLETAVESVLSSVQDSVSKQLRIPWPSTDGRRMALPGVNFDGESIHSWYGAIEEEPVLKLREIPIAEILTM